jgi:hypothetical protein
MVDIERIPPERARQHMAANSALFICAYESEEKCQQHRLAGAISLREFQARLPGIARNQELIFYCA